MKERPLVPDSAEFDQRKTLETELLSATTKRNYGNDDRKTLDALVALRDLDHPHTNVAYQLMPNGAARITMSVKPEFAPPEPPTPDLE